MIRTLMAAAAVSGLMLSAALAQTSGAPNRGDANAQVITQQAPSQWLGSKLMGTDVIGANSEKIGDVSDVLIDKSGKVDALVVGVGGFLGIGTKDVALPMTVFEVVPAGSGANNTNSDQLRLSMTKDQLQQHAEFRTLDNRTTTGAGPAGNSGSTMSPSSSPSPSANPNMDRGAGAPR
jgi:sporulation protein YlmC with PRC-barrel domain